MLSLSDIVNVKVGIGRGVFEAPGATVIGGKKPSFNLEILKLFANGEQGFWYDPSDMGTMFQDTAGTTAVNAVGQPLGLVLDKSKGMVLGPENVINGSLATLTGWETPATAPASVTLVAGGVRLYSPAGEVATLRQQLALKRGGWYEVQFNVKSITGSGYIALYAGAAGLHRYGFSTSGVKTIYLQASPTGDYLLISRSTICDFVISDVSVKELTGNHAYQSTSAARPILQDAPRRIDFDTVDDKLITNLPAQLTNCTVIRSVPGVGVQLLTNQTIPATYEDNKDHCGLIVINRALTPSETSAIAAEFNKRAGV